MSIFFKILKVSAGFNILWLKMIYGKKLSISLPSISFSLNPFKLGRGSKTSIGKRAILGRHSEIIVLGELIIGNNFCLNKYSRIVAHEKITIGSNVTIAQFVSILDHDHAYHLENENLIFNGYTTAPIEIGNNVWIGDKVAINKGVKIGNNVIIGANSVVTKNIEDNCVAVGNPCKKIKVL
jgi:maltose O-acetyltransferase